MMQRFRLGGVLKARQAQEDAAKAKVALANAEADRAAVHVQTRERDLDGHVLPDQSTAAAFSAAISARQAIATALYAAIGVADAAGEVVQATTEDLAAAATRRRALEKLAERHAVTRQRAQEQADQRAIDDLTTAAYARRRSEVDE
jgi:flagellar export protein FliJ